MNPEEQSEVNIVDKFVDTSADEDSNGSESVDSVANPLLAAAQKIADRVKTLSSTLGQKTLIEQAIERDIKITPFLLSILLDRPQDPDLYPLGTWLRDKAAPFIKSKREMPKQFSSIPLSEEI